MDDQEVNPAAGVQLVAVLVQPDDPIRGLGAKVTAYHSVPMKRDGGKARS